MNSTGSEWVVVAVLGRTRGNRGELTALPLTSKPERYESLHQVFLLRDIPGASNEPYELESVWFHNGTPIFKFRGIDSISDAEALVGAEVRVPISERAPLEPGEFFESDLIGCQVFDRHSGEALGPVKNWVDGGGSGLLELETGLLIPFARSICVLIDPSARRIEVELPEGLKDLNVR